MSKIFISYRRDDSKWPTGRLHDYLSARFGKGQVFIDITNIEPGEDFVNAIEKAVGESSALIAMIGSNWLSIRDSEDQRRLDDPYDFVRLEIAHALERGIRVIPVLIDDTPMPRQDQLPDVLDRLARRHALRLRNESFRYDAAQLTKALENVLSMETRVVIAGQWIDDTHTIHAFFKQIRDRVVGFYGIGGLKSERKLGVFFGTIIGNIGNLEWKWLDGSVDGQAQAQASDDAERLSLDHWIKDDQDNKNSLSFSYVSDDMPDWVTEEDFGEFARFLRGDLA